MLQEALRVRNADLERELTDARATLAVAQHAISSAERAHSSAARALELAVAKVRGVLVVVDNTLHVTKGVLLACVV